MSERKHYEWMPPPPEMFGIPVYESAYAEPGTMYIVNPGIPGLEMVIRGARPLTRRQRFIRALRRLVRRPR